MPSPDCGMKYLPRASAFGKLRALSRGAAIVRRELTGEPQEALADAGGADGINELPLV